MVLYLDAETPPIDRGKLAQRPVCVQIAHDDGPVRVELWRDWDQRLEGHIVGANVAYDFACAMVGNPSLTPEVFRAYDEGRVTDVLLDGKLLDIAAGEYGFRSTRGWSLQELARRVGMHIDKDDDDETGNGSWRMRFAALDGIPVENWPDGARVYAAGDIEATRAVYLWQQQERAKWQAQGLDPLAPRHSAHAAASAFALHLIQCQGIHTDPATVEAVAARVEAYLERVSKRLQMSGLVRGNGSRDTRKAARAMVDVCAKAKMDVPRTDGAEKKEKEALEKIHALESNGLGPCSNAEVKKLAALHDQWHAGVHLPGVQVNKDQAILGGSRVLELYAEYAGAGLIRGRTERLRQGYTLPLQARFDAMKETTRTSCTQPMEPLVGEQMQNFPRLSGVTPEEKKRERGYIDKHGVYHKPEWFTGLHECFIPPPGFVFIVCDYPSAELHSLAELCHRLFGYSELGRLLNEGRDVHQHFAMRTKGLRYEDYDKKTMKPERDRVKPGVYGFPVGMGPDKFRLYSRKGYGILFSDQEARQLKAEYLATFFDVAEYLKHITRILGDNATITDVHPITGFVRGDCYYSRLANNGFQHLTAMGAKAALYEVTKACFTPGSPLWRCRPWNFVHDEIPCIAPIDRAPEAAVELGRLMDEAFNRYHPNYPLKCEPVVCTRWSKKAEAIYDSNKRLEAWSPPLQVAA